MKKITFRIYPISLLILAIVITIVIWLIMTKVAALNRESKKYADDSIIAIVSGWDIRSVVKIFEKLLLFCFDITSGF